MKIDNPLVWLAAGLLIVSLVYFFVPFDYDHILQNPGQLGYAGVFFVMLISNATIFLPLPGLAIVAAFGPLPGVNPLLVGVAAGLGGGVGEVTGYILGRGGEKALMARNPERYNKVRGWLEKHGIITIIILAAIPNPAFDLVGIVAGALKYEWWKFGIAAIIGNTVKCVVIATFSWAAAYYIGSSLMALALLFV
ncbi:MAG: VTT domain-containing protein [Candidatus Micrarchaeota archaeon]